MMRDTTTVILIRSVNMIRGVLGPMYVNVLRAQLRFKVISMCLNY